MAFRVEKKVDKVALERLFRGLAFREHAGQLGMKGERRRKKRRSIRRFGEGALRSHKWRYSISR